MQHYYNHLRLNHRLSFGDTAFFKYMRVSLFFNRDAGHQVPATFALDARIASKYEILRSTILQSQKAKESTGIL